MKMKRVSMTLNASGGGTATTDAPVWGEVAEITGTAGTAFIGSGTVTVTREADSATIYSGAPGTNAWAIHPYGTLHTAGGGSVGADAPIPVDGYLKVVVLGGGTAAATRSGNIDIYVR